MGVLLWTETCWVPSTLLLSTFSTRNSQTTKTFPLERRLCCFQQKAKWDESFSVLLWRTFQKTSEADSSLTLKSFTGIIIKKVYRWVKLDAVIIHHSNFIQLCSNKRRERMSGWIHIRFAMIIPSCLHTCPLFIFALIFISARLASLLIQLFPLFPSAQHQHNETSNFLCFVCFWLA